MNNIEAQLNTTTMNRFTVSKSGVAKKANHAPNESDIEVKATGHVASSDTGAMHPTARRATRTEGGYVSGSDMPDIWMQRNGKASLLSAAQEIALAQRVERGDSEAREALMDANVRLVAAVARKYQGKGIALEDLMQEGMVGLLRAIEKYNYRKGYRFSTYATHWIRQAVSRACANQGRPIRLPAHVVDTITRISRIREEMFHQMGRLPSRAELATEAGITEAKLLGLLKNAAPTLSLESPVGSEGEAVMADFIPADDANSPSEIALKNLMYEELDRALSGLLERERDVLTLRYGLGFETQHTLEETGKCLGITRERARQIEAKALDKLRHGEAAGRLWTAVN